MPVHVSVIIIFLNAKRFIREAVESVLAQTHESWELLLVDDGSSDASSRIAQEYATAHPGRIRYMEHDGHANRGMSASRNLGIRSATGAYLAFLDSDDVWHSNKLARQVALLLAHPDAGMVYGRTEYWHSWTGNPDDATLDHVADLGVPADTLFPPPELVRLLYPFGRAPAPCLSDLMVRRGLVADVGGFEECFTGDNQLYEDQAFLIKVYLIGTVFASGETWERYRIHPDSCDSTVIGDGKYHAVRSFFLRWLEAYLRDNNLEEPAVWRALRKALAAADTDRRPDQDRWMLRVVGGSIADLVFPPEEPDVVRIAIERASTPHAFDIQLNLPNLAVSAGRHYTIRFRVRADSARSLQVGLAQAHRPWAGLGWWRQLDLTEDWQSFEDEIVARADEGNARIHFDLGDSGVSVDVAAVTLTPR